MWPYWRKCVTGVGFEVSKDLLPSKLTPLSACKSSCEPSVAALVLGLPAATCLDGDGLLPLSQHKPQTNPVSCIGHGILSEP